jgi:Cu(I)/Ag(I) efflux system membrane fusion protein
MQFKPLKIWPGCSGKRQSEEVAHHDKHALLGVRGSCEMCKERIEKEANSIPGVTSASYNLEKEQLHFHFDESKTSVDAVSKALAAVGHDTERG